MINLKELREKAERAKDFKADFYPFMPNTTVLALVESIEIAIKALKLCDYAITEISELRRPGVNVTTTAGDAIEAIKKLVEFD